MCHVREGTATLMIETVAPEIEILELIELDSRIVCDIGNHTNPQAQKCPEEAQWRVFYSCCLRSSLMCTQHKDAFVALCMTYADEVTVCSHCKVANFITNVLKVEPL